jgi:hypothetical protein
MVFFLGEKMIVTGSGEGKQQAERQSFHIQMSKSMLRGSDFWLFGEEAFLWTAVETLGGLRTCECLNNWQHAWATMVNVTAWLSFLAALLCWPCHRTAPYGTPAGTLNLPPPPPPSNINTNWIAVADLFCFH